MSLLMHIVTHVLISHLVLPFSQSLEYKDMQFPVKLQQKVVMQSLGWPTIYK